MTIKKPLVETAGAVQELPSGDYLQVPNLAIAEGSATPDPGGIPARGVVIWSTTTSSLLRWSGTTWNAVDSGVIAPTTVTVSFPSSGSNVITQEVSYSGAVVGQKVMASISLDMPVWVAQDEIELEPLTVAGVVSATDTVRLIVSSINGTNITGNRNINLQVS